MPMVQKHQHRGIPQFLAAGPAALLQLVPGCPRRKANRARYPYFQRSPKTVPMTAAQMSSWM